MELVPGEDKIFTSTKDEEIIEISDNYINNKYIKESFAIMRLMVTVGWSIYPLGYFYGGDVTLNIIYNLADFVDNILINAGAIAT